MKALVVLGISLSLGGCAVAGQGRSTPSEMFVRSNHRDAVEVYAVCGRTDAVRLGVVPGRGDAVFEVPREATVCVSGVQFAMVPLGAEPGRGYVTNPMAVPPGRGIEMWIERYAPLSAVRVR